MENSTPFIFRSTIGSQFVLTIAVLFILFVFLISVETVYKSYLQMSSSRVPLYPYTVSSNKQIVIPQDPADPKAKTAFFSENERSGIEFSYSTFLFVQESTFGDTTTIKPVFHKGYKYPFPLCAPGVFVLGNSNTLRIIMNSYSKWYNSVDVNDIPVNKWFHLALVCRNNSLDVYINGNIATKLTLEGTIPYQNYQPVVLFSSDRTNRITVPASGSSGQRYDVPSGVGFEVGSPINGYISNLIYYRYAISFSEIQADMTAGPSKEFASDSMDMPPYLIDSWWTNRSA